MARFAEGVIREDKQSNRWVRVVIEGISSLGPGRNFFFFSDSGSLEL